MFHFFYESRAVYEIKWKIQYSGLATDDNMVHVHCMPDT